MKKVVLLISLMLSGAHGATLHYGDRAVTLDTMRRTRPSLAIGMGGTTYYATMNNGDVPTGALRVGNLWVGQNCPVGTYSTDGFAACTDCGMGYFCAGATHRNPCTYGAIGCPGTTHGTDGALPNNAPINTFMELTDVEKYIPASDISQWRLVEQCKEKGEVPADCNIPESVNDIRAACAHRVIGPGTYLFIAHYSTWGSQIDSVTGESGTVTTVQIAVFNHPVEYRAVHGVGVFQFFVDTEHDTYQSYTILSAPIGAWATNINATNVSGISHHIGAHYLAVYELQ